MFLIGSYAKVLKEENRALFVFSLIKMIKYSNLICSNLFLMTTVAVSTNTCYKLVNSRPNRLERWLRVCLVRVKVRDPSYPNFYQHNYLVPSVCSFTLTIGSPCKSRAYSNIVNGFECFYYVSRELRLRLCQYSFSTKYSSKVLLQIILYRISNTQYFYSVLLPGARTSPAGEFVPL